jgi:hypothetical protein
VEATLGYKGDSRDGILDFLLTLAKGVKKPQCHPKT